MLLLLETMHYDPGTLRAYADVWVVGGVVAPLQADTIVRGDGIDGVFIDGFRGNVGAGGEGPPVSPPGGTNAKKAFAAAYGKGLVASMALLRTKIGPKATIIGNYGASITGVDGVGAMVERGGSGVKDIQALQGYAAQNKTVEFHAQYAEKGSVFNASLAAFLCGAGENAFYGAGVGWEFEGPGGCAAWLADRPVEIN